MDIQRKKGILDICVLAALKNKPSYGYELIGKVSQCIPISESTLYPILKRLESSDCLTTYRHEYNGRIRKYYRITQNGINRINDFLIEWEEMRQIYEFVDNLNREESK